MQIVKERKSVLFWKENKGSNSLHKSGSRYETPLIWAGNVTNTMEQSPSWEE